LEQESRSESLLHIFEKGTHRERDQQSQLQFQQPPTRGRHSQSRKTRIARNEAAKTFGKSVKRISTIKTLKEKAKKHRATDK